MIIDFHTHVFPEKIEEAAIASLSGRAHMAPHIRATADALVASQEAAGIGLSVVLPVATAARQVEKLNDAAARLNEAYAGRLLSLGAIHPDYENCREELARIKALGLPGIKLHPVYQGADIDDIRFLRILARAAELDLLVITHAGDDIGYPGVVHCSPAMIRHALTEVGPMRFVAAHMGGWRNWDVVPELLADTGCFLDTAFSQGSFSPLPDGYWDDKSTAMLSAEGMTALIKAFGADRVLFGTDSPWSSQAEERTAIQRLPLTEEEKEAVLGGNAAKLLGLPV